MKAVWSLWTKPLHAGPRLGWLTLKHHLLSWVLSVELARQYFPETQLVTDDAGAAMLIDGLGLDFGSVSLALNALSDTDPEWWAIGKLHAYRLQEAPFVHLDSDVYLWEPLPPELVQAPVFAQHPEMSPYGASFYRPESIGHDIRRHDGWMPTEFDQYMPIGGEIRAENCGILGGTRCDFLRYYADLAIRFIEHPANCGIWKRRQRHNDMVTIEQLLLSACLAYHQERKGSTFANISIATLFADWGAVSEADARGFTHLVSGAKHDPEITEALERIVAADYPDQYSRCLALLDSLQEAATPVS